MQHPALRQRRIGQIRLLVSDIQRLCTQVPFESLKRTTRDRKVVVDELTAIVEALQQTSGDAAATQERRAEVLNDVDRRVGSLKRKVPLSLIQLF